MPQIICKREIIYVYDHAYENSFAETVDAGIIIKLIEIVIFYRYEISRSGG